MANEHTPTNDATPYTNVTKESNKAKEYNKQNEMTDVAEANNMDNENYQQNDVTPNDMQNRLRTDRGESYDRMNDGNGMAAGKSKVQKNEERKNEHEPVSGYMSASPEEVQLQGEEMKGYKTGKDLKEEGLVDDPIQSFKHQ